MKEVRYQLFRTGKCKEKEDEWLPGVGVRREWEENS
jgi:hypothetical protein